MDTFTLGMKAAITGGLATDARDRARAALVLRAARTPEEKAAALRFVMDRRAERRAWVTVTQRKWQAKTRRPSRARHHDSVAIREEYVRGTAY